MRRAVIVAAAAASALVIAALAAATPFGSQPTPKRASYVVVYEQGVSKAAVRAAIRAAGGTLVRENARIGVATVVSRNPRFIAAATRDAALVGAVRNRPMGRVKPGFIPKVDVDMPAVRRVLNGKQARSARYRYSKTSSAEPLASVTTGGVS